MVEDVDGFEEFLHWSEPKGKEWGRRVSLLILRSWFDEDILPEKIMLPAKFKEQKEHFKTYSSKYISDYKSLINGKTIHEELWSTTR